MSHLFQSNAFESNASANVNADESNANASANAAFALAFAYASAFEHKPATRRRPIGEKVRRVVLHVSW